MDGRGWVCLVQVKGRLPDKDSGVYDPERHQAIKAYVVLKKGFEPSMQLVEELCENVRKAVGPPPQHQRVEFVEEMPKTATLKLRRSKLRKRRG
ncbi:MAG: hypothetical protein QXM16_01180 [Nitrososphaerota archaeon]